jgi:hypothetical protein
MVNSQFILTNKPINTNLLVFKIIKKMKNFLIVLLLLIVAAFVWLVLKPEHDLSQKVFGYLNISVSKNIEISQEVDLTDCISYFDGCNTCMVEDGVIVWCTKMFCETSTQPMCLEYKRTWMDLTDCISYFDGCNTCTVKDGRPHACTLMYCETPSEPKCLEYETDENLEDELNQDSREVDLTNCLTYFDGCNTCDVENWETIACTEIFCEEYQEPKCTQYASDVVSIENETLEDLDIPVENN